MAWLWWLTAPIVMTAGGAMVVSWRDRRASSSRRRDPILAHAELLRALAQSTVASRHADAAPDSTAA